MDALHSRRYRSSALCCHPALPAPCPGVPGADGSTQIQPRTRGDFFFRARGLPSRSSPPSFWTCCCFTNYTVCTDTLKPPSSLLSYPPAPLLPPSPLLAVHRPPTPNNPGESQAPPPAAMTPASSHANDVEKEPKYHNAPLADAKAQFDIEISGEGQQHQVKRYVRAATKTA